MLPAQVGVFDREPSKSWVRGPVTLVGDAAAAMPPNLGQGGNKALENAGLLAACLARYGPSSGADNGIGC